MSRIIVLKTGDSAIFSMTCVDEDEVAVDITNYTIDVDFINPITGVEILSTSIGSGITVTAASAGTFEVDGGATINWPIGKMPIDIKYTDPNGVAQHTQNFYIKVKQGLSQ